MPTDTWNRLPAARRDAVLAAAEAEFSANGFSRGSLNVIAREAGVAKGSLFQYFDDKIDLFAHLSERAVDRIGDSMAVQADVARLGRRLLPGLRPARRHVDRLLHRAPGRPLALGGGVPRARPRRALRGAGDHRPGSCWRSCDRCSRPHSDDGWLRADADLDAFLAMLLLVLPHLALAPSFPELDPVLGLGGTDPHAAASPTGRRARGGLRRLRPAPGDRRGSGELGQSPPHGPSRPRRAARTPRRCRPSSRTGSRRACRTACAASRRWRRAGRASCSSARSSRTAAAGTGPGSSSPGRPAGTA